MTKKLTPEFLATAPFTARGYLSTLRDRILSKAGKQNYVQVNQLPVPSEEIYDSEGVLFTISDDPKIDNIELLAEFRAFSDGEIETLELSFHFIAEKGAIAAAAKAIDEEGNETSFLTGEKTHALLSDINQLNSIMSAIDQILPPPQDGDDTPKLNFF